MIRQAFGEESINCTREVQIHLDRKRRDRRRAKPRAAGSLGGRINTRMEENTLRGKS
jgi:hypothetical protein